MFTFELFVGAAPSNKTKDMIHSIIGCYLRLYWPQLTKNDTKHLRMVDSLLNRDSAAHQRREKSLRVNVMAATGAGQDGSRPATTWVTGDL